jgi:hypothetical protein
MCTMLTEGAEMSTTDADVFAWAIGKALLILVSSFGTVVSLAWIAVRKGLMK